MSEEEDVDSGSTSDEEEQEDPRDYCRGQGVQCCSSHMTPLSKHTNERLSFISALYIAERGGGGRERGEGV